MEPAPADGAVVIINLCLSPIRLGRKVVPPTAPLQTYVWMPPGNIIRFKTGAPLQELRKAKLVVFPNLMWCSLYPGTNGAYRKGRRVVKPKRSFPVHEPVLKKVVINVCCGGYGVSKACVAELEKIKGTKFDEGWDEPERDDADFIRLIEEGRINCNAQYSKLKIVEVDVSREWEITVYDGTEGIRYLS